MKRVYLTLYLSVLGAAAMAQKLSIKWGDEFKVRGLNADLKVVCADNTGAYLQEGNLVRWAAATLVKVDKNLAEVYRVDFNKELKDKEFEQFFVFQDQLLLFASNYNRQRKIFTVYASPVDKNSGKLKEEWKEIAVFQQSDKADDTNFKIDYNADSTKILMVSSTEGAERNEYKIQEFDIHLAASAKPLIIRNEFEPKKYELEDVLYTNNRNVVLVGRRYEYEEGKKKKEKFLEFTNYNIRIYNENGKQQSEINTSINGKWLTSTKLLQEKNKDLILAAFYSNEKKGKTIDGMLVQRIDVASGKIVSTSDRQINNSLLSEDHDQADNDSDNDDADDSKEEKKRRKELRKMKEEGEGFSKYMQFRKIFYTADNGIIILAEKYDHYVTTSQGRDPISHGGAGQYSSTSYAVHISGELMMCKIDPSGNIGWLQVLPKKQREEITVSSSAAPFPISSPSRTSYFVWDEGRPFYSGFSAFQTNGNIQMLFNDNPKNGAVTQAGQKAKAIYHYDKSDCFVVNVDETSGKISRKVLFNNTDIPTAMPRLGVIIGNDMYMVGRDFRGILRKSKIAIAKITIR